MSAGPMSAGPMSAGPADASVVVCAYTPARWDDLEAGVRGSLAQGAGEVLVVIDHHDGLLARAREVLAPLGAVVVPNDRARGLSGARNTAIALARRPVVVFLDDDATPAPGWLAALLAPYADPRVAAVGGAAEPVWPGVGRPAQLPRELDWVIGCTYTGQPESAAVVRNLMGCNMSFRREVFDEVGGFDETAGRIGAIPLGCEETELCIRLGQRRPDVVLVHEPAAVVRHRVSADRTGWAYLRRRAYAEGLSKASVARLVGAGDATSVEREYVRRVLPRGVRRELGRAVRGDADGWRAAGGIVTALGATTLGYLRGRAGGDGAVGRSATRARAVVS